MSDSQQNLNYLLVYDNEWEIVKFFKNHVTTISNFK